MGKFEMIKDFNDGYVFGIIRIGKSYKIHCDKDIADDLISDPNAKVYKVYSRDCRFSDNTKTFVGLHAKSRGLMVLYKQMRRQLSYDRCLSDIIINDKIVRTGTSTYELADEEYQ